MARVKTPEPTKLYRYRSLSSAKQLNQELSALSERYLWCSKFTELNDPMEGTYRLALKDKLSPQSRFITRELYDEKCALGICSFSETDDNAIMWAHYADGFAGMCIEYDFARLKRGLTDQYLFVRMAYNENENELTIKAARANGAAQTILSYKSYRWLYEREWRMISPRPRENSIPEGGIISVLLGRRMKKEHKRAVLAALKPLGIPHRDMTIDGYRIDFSPPEEFS